MSSGVGRRDPELLWLWCRPAATAPIRPLAWEPPYAVGAAQEMAKKQKNKQTKKKTEIYQCLLVSVRDPQTIRKLSLLLKIPCNFWAYHFQPGKVHGSQML